MRVRTRARRQPARPVCARGLSAANIHLHPSAPFCSRANAPPRKVLLSICLAAHEHARAHAQTHITRVHFVGRPMLIIPVRSATQRIHTCHAADGDVFFLVFGCWYVCVCFVWFRFNNYCAHDMIVPSICCGAVVFLLLCLAAPYALAACCPIDIILPTWRTRECFVHLHSTAAAAEEIVHEKCAGKMHLFGLSP